MKLLELVNEGMDDMKKNSPFILAIGACVGVAATAFVSVFAGKKLKVKEEAVEQKLEEKRAAGEEVTKKDIHVEHFKAAAPTLAPVVGLSAVTMICMIFSYKISAKRIAALTTAYTLTSKAYAEYRKAAQKILGEKEKEIERERFKNEVNEDPMSKELEDKVRESNKDIAEKYRSGSTTEIYSTVPVWKERVTNQYFRITEGDLEKTFGIMNDRLKSGSYDELTVNDWLREIKRYDNSVEVDRAAGNLVGWPYDIYKHYKDGIPHDLSDGVKAENGLFVGRCEFEWKPLYVGSDTGDLGRY